VRWVVTSCTLLSSLVASAGLALVVPRVAQACSCVGAAELVTPAVDEAHPADAGLLFGAWCFSGTFDNFSVTIDDVPATLSFEYLGGEYAGSEWHVATIDPLPQPGQVVTVSRCGADAFERCTPETPIETLVQYTAGPSDTDAPATGGAVTLQHESGEFEVGCLEIAALRFDVAVTGLDPGSDADLLYTIELRDGGGRLVDSTTIHAPEPITALDESFYAYEAPVDAADHCISVTATDLSGNSTLVAELCGSMSLDPPDDTGEDTGSDTDDIPPDDDSGDAESGDIDDPPSDDTTPLDVDDDGSSTDVPDADAGLGDRGCACRSTTRSPSVGWLALLVLCLHRRRAPSSRD
jgi:hypothetical protein